MSKKKLKESDSEFDSEKESEPENQKMPEVKEVPKNKDIKNHSKFDKFKRGEIKLNGNE